MKFRFSRKREIEPRIELYLYHIPHRNQSEIEDSDCHGFDTMISCHGCDLIY